MSPLATFQASSPQVQVDAAAAQAVAKGMLVRDLARELLAMEGLPLAEARGWLPQQAWLNVHRRIRDALGPDTLYAVGRNIPMAARFPRMVDVPGALAAINDAYREAHRGGEIGEYRFTELGPGHFQLLCDTPYAAEFDRGILDALIDRFRGRDHYRVWIAPCTHATRWLNASIFDIQRQA